MSRSSLPAFLSALALGAGLLGAGQPAAADEDEPVKAENPNLPKQELTPQILQQLLLAEIARAMGVRLPQPAVESGGRIADLQGWLAADLARQPSLDEMATYLGLSRFHLLRSFQKQVGLSPRQWAMQLRTRRAQALLRAGLPATEVAHELGFADQSHLNRHFRAAYGVSPGSFQRALR